VEYQWKSLKNGLKNPYGLGETALTFVCTLEDNIDRCSFFYELNIGWYDMYGDPELDSRDPYNLSGRDTYYSYVMKKK
jgi:hypothetical protein